ncbi:MAG: hypothetical protein ABI947_28210 [Chloroflexota bacterium]
MGTYTYVIPPRIVVKSFQSGDPANYKPAVHRSSPSLVADWIA